MRLIIPLLLGGIFILGCTPTVKKVVLHKKPDRDIVVVKRSSFKLTQEERTFVKKEARKFGIEVPERKEIERFIRFYLKDKRSLRIALKRASLYVPYIKPVLKEYGLPEELALLPLVESGFNPFAVSPSGAAGIWQLMPQTARRFGLRVDSKVDERFDLIKSTHAAARYLKELHRRFGSWELVLAAYNCGEGCVQRRTGSRDFWRTKWALPEQTRKYVPMFFAALLITRSPEKYGIEMDTDMYLFERKVAGRDYRVREFVKNRGIKESTFRDLNPHIRGDYIPAGVYVYIPKVEISKAGTKGELSSTKPSRKILRKKVAVVRLTGKNGAFSERVSKPFIGKTKPRRKPAFKKKIHKAKKIRAVKKVVKLSKTKIGRAKARMSDPKPAPKLVIRSEKGEEVRILQRKARVITLENGALLYIKE